MGPTTPYEINLICFQPFPLARKSLKLILLQHELTGEEEERGRGGDEEEEEEEEGRSSGGEELAGLLAGLLAGWLAGWLALLENTRPTFESASRRGI